MNTFKLIISSPDGNIFEGDATMITLRGVEGDLAIMAGHIPFVTAVKSAPCAVWLDEETRKEAYSEGGLLTVGSGEATFISGTFKFNE